MCMPSNKRKRKISNQNKKKLLSDIDLILIKIWFNVRQCIALQQGIRIYFNVLSSRLTYLPFYKACGRTPGLMPRDKKGKEGEKKRIFKKKKLLKMKNKKRQSLYSERISQHHNTHAELQWSYFKVHPACTWAYMIHAHAIYARSKQEEIKWFAYRAH